VLAEGDVVAPIHGGVEVEVELEPMASPANRPAPGSVARSSMWETRRVPVSLSASSDRIEDAAGTTDVPG